MTDQPLRVLLVDDSPMFLVGATALLMELRVLIVGATSSTKEAVKLVEGLQPDLVLIEAMMPGLNGFDTTRLLKRRPQPPRVVIVTLCDSEIAREAARNAEADGLLPKAQLNDHLPPLLVAMFGAERVRTRPTN